jgi:hypothetical protein
MRDTSLVIAVTESRGWIVAVLRSSREVLAPNICRFVELK